MCSLDTNTLAGFMFLVAVLIILVCFLPMHVLVVALLRPRDRCSSFSAFTFIHDVDSTSKMLASLSLTPFSLNRKPFLCPF